MNLHAAVVHVVVNADVPVEIGRDEARRLAAEELAKPEYHVDDPSLSERLIAWLWEKFNELLDSASGVIPGGLWGLVALALVVGAVAALVFWRNGPVRRTGRADTRLFVGRVRSAREYRAAADAAATAGQWELAVQERYRAIVRSLEERTILDPRPGRTADEAAATAGLSLPELARDLGSAATTFDAVTYGGRPANSTDNRFLIELDRSSQAARPRDLGVRP